LPTQDESLHEPQRFDMGVGERVKIRALSPPQAGVEAGGAPIAVGEGPTPGDSAATRARGVVSKRMASTDRTEARFVIFLSFPREMSVAQLSALPRLGPRSFKAAVSAYSDSDPKTIPHRQLATVRVALQPRLAS
jgi:hypothetical protein